MPPSAAAADVRITSVRATDGQKVAVTVVTSQPTSRPPTLRENGKPVAGLGREPADGKSVVLAIDRSQSMEGEAFRRTRSRPPALRRTKPPTDRLAIIGFGSKAIQSDAVLVRHDRRRYRAARAVHRRRQGTAWNDALALARQIAAPRTRPPAPSGLLTDGTDTSSEIGEWPRPRAPAARA